MMKKMNNLSKLLVVIFCSISLTFFQSCQNSLPEPTQTGADTFGMLVNGNVWKTGGVNTYINSKYYKSIKTLTVQAQITKGTTSETFFFVVNNFSGKGVYNMNYRLTNTPNSTYPYDSTRFWYNDDFKNSLVLPNENTATISFVKFDSAENIVSGNFIGRLMNKKKEELILTEGRFDLKFNKF